MDVAKKNILQAKYARIIEIISQEKAISIPEAMSIFYNSMTFELIDGCVSDLHCRSDHYLADEVMSEIYVTS